MNWSANIISILVIVGPVVLMSSCQGNPPEATSSTVSTVATPSSSEALTAEELGDVGAKIWLEPENIDDILAAHDLTPMEFGQALNGVSSNSDVARQYEQSFQLTRQRVRQIDGRTLKKQPYLPDVTTGKFSSGIGLTGNRQPRTRERRFLSDGMMAGQTRLFSTDETADGRGQTTLNLSVEGPVPRF